MIVPELIQQLHAILRIRMQVSTQSNQARMEAQDLLTRDRNEFWQVKTLLVSAGVQASATVSPISSLEPNADVHFLFVQAGERVHDLAEAIKRTLQSPPSNWKLVETWQAHKKPLLGGPNISLTFSPDGKHLYSSGPDKILRMWDIETRTEFRSWRIPAEQIEITLDGRIFIVMQEKKILLYDTTNWNLMRSITNIEKNHHFTIHAISRPIQNNIAGISACAWFTREGQVTGIAAHGIFVWNLDVGSYWYVKVGDMEGNIKYVPISTLVTSDGNWLLASWADGLLKIFQNDKIKVTFKQDPITSCDFSPNGAFLVSGGVDRTVRLWDLKNNVEVWKGLFSKEVIKVIFSPDGKLIAASSLDRNVKLFSAQDGREVAAFDVSILGSPTDLKFSPNGQLLAISGKEQICILQGEWPNLASKVTSITQAITEVEYFYEQMLSRISTKYYQLGEAETYARLQKWLAEFDRTLTISSANWSHELWQTWAPQTISGSTNLVRIGTMQIAFSQENQRISLPALFFFPNNKSLIIKEARASNTTAARAAQSLLLRLLASIPPGKLRFTFIDPVGLGQNAAPFMHLADYDEQLVTGKAWSEPQHIEQRLADLTEHMENVIQQYLRNQYATIEDYNAQAGEIAEPYRVLVVFDFPVNFNETAARRLVSIVQNGPRCGVYAAILMDTDKPLPYGFNPTDLEQNAEVIAWQEDRWVWQDEDFKECTLELDTPPEAELFNRIVTAVGEAAKASSKVEVPFERIAPSREEWWHGDSRSGIRVPLGPAGARKVQELAFGHGTAQHALVAGKTGSGKSTLLHTLITNLALAYSPDEVELYLIDFKKGVEFKTYAAHQLPHARVVAIESEREFGLSVLQGLDAELKRRGDLFRAAGADHIADYRQKTDQKLPRILLLVDEFQEFFTEDDAISSQASQILDRLVRQGRAFGLHVLLGSQTLAGAYTLARSTIDQMAVRIALQCSEADSRLILADDNPAARLLSRPGEAIYNDANGLVEGNSRFQVAWLPDDRRDGYLAQVVELATQRAYRPPRPQIVFEGNAPAEVEKNRPLHDLLTASEWPASTRRVLAWLGDPIAIRDPIAATFRRQSGSNLLIVGQNDEAALGMMTVALISLASQLPSPDAGRADRAEGVTFYVLNFGAVDAPHAGLWDQLAGILPNLVKVGRRRQLPEFIAELAAEVQQRLDNEQPGAPSRYLFLYGLQRARDLRQEEMGFGGFGGFGEEPAAPNPAQQFTTILREGPDLGIHTLVWCDTMTNLNRSLERRALREFAMRVAFQMSAEDSANLLDSPLASKLGPYRALFYDEEEGRLEKFRPYGLPSEGWLSQVKEWLKGRG